MTWLDTLLGRHRETHVSDGTRVQLDKAESRLAGRLSRLTGKNRDDVLAEAYRRADHMISERK